MSVSCRNACQTPHWLQRPERGFVLPGLCRNNTGDGAADLGDHVVELVAQHRVLELHVEGSVSDAAAVDRVAGETQVLDATDVVQGHDGAVVQKHAGFGRHAHARGRWAVRDGFDERGVGFEFAGDAVCGGEMAEYMACPSRRCCELTSQ